MATHLLDEAIGWFWEHRLTPRRFSRVERLEAYPPGKESGIQTYVEHADLDSVSANYVMSRKPSNDLVALVDLARLSLAPSLQVFAGVRACLIPDKCWDARVDVREIVAKELPDQLVIIEHMGTRAPNYDLTTDDIARELRSMNDRWGVDVLGADRDTVMMRFQETPRDVDKVTKQLYEFCIDLDLEHTRQSVAEGTAFTLWWD